MWNVHEGRPPGDIFVAVLTLNKYIVGWTAVRNNYDKLMEVGGVSQDGGPSRPGDSESARAGAGSSVSGLSAIPCSCPLDTTVENLPQSV